jgi:phytoene/squalene synthetase
LAELLYAGGVMRTVDQSYDYCLRVARTRAKNFYYSFMLLSAQQAPRLEARVVLEE